MSQNQQAEVVYKFIADSGGIITAVNQITGANIKLAASETELTKKIETRKQALLEQLAITQRMPTQVARGVFTLRESVRG